MKPRILQLVGSLESGGSERQAVALTRRLVDDGSFEVFFSTLNRNGALLEHIDWTPRDSIPEFRLTSFYDLNFAVQLKAFIRFARENSIDLLHTHDFYSNIFGMFAGRLARLPVRIASKRETESKSRMQFQLERRAFRFAHKIVVNSNLVGSYLSDHGVLADKLVTIHNGTDLSEYSNWTLTPIEGRTILQCHGVGISEPIVTIVANMRSEVKNHDLFFQAAATVKARHPETQFLLVGEGELTDLYKARAGELGISECSHFLGGRNDVPEILAASDVCVLTSRSEGFSNAVLEYMAAGRPVVATRVGGASEAIVENETGFLVDSGDHERLAERIGYLLSHKDVCRKFGANGRKRVEENFSSQAQLARTVELYKGLLTAQ